MTQSDIEQAVTYVALQQLVHDWVYILDSVSGEGVARLLTDDCAYAVPGGVRVGTDEVETHYRERRARLPATPGGLPVMRHVTANLRVLPADADTARILFNLVFFIGQGGPPPYPADVAAVADVDMDCRRDSDGRWRIARFDSVQIFNNAPR